MDGPSCHAGLGESRGKERRAGDRSLVGRGKPAAEWHLNASQRAMIAAELATMSRGARTDLASSDAMSDAQAAKLLNVSEPSVERAKAVKRQAIPEVADAVKAGEMSVASAAKVARKPRNGADGCTQPGWRSARRRAMRGRRRGLGNAVAARLQRLDDRLGDAAGLRQVFVVASMPRRPASLWRRVADIHKRLDDGEDQIMVLPGVHVGDHSRQQLYRRVTPGSGARENGQRQPGLSSRGCHLRTAPSLSPW